MKLPLLRIFISIIKSNLALMNKDSQDEFKDFVEPLQSMADKSEASRTVQIPADGN